MRRAGTAWAGVVGPLQARVAFEPDHGPRAVALKLHRLSTLGTAGRLDLQPPIASIDEQRQGGAHEAATLAAGFGFELAKRGSRMLIVPVLEDVKELPGSLHEGSAALLTRHGARHR